MLSPADFQERVALPSGHVLRPVRRRQSRSATAAGCRRTVYWFRQLDAQRRTVAHYRVWVEQALTPPYRRRVGWEQFSLTGQILDREVHCPTPPTDRSLH